jgi:uncharacterized protein YqjF (DUF2071 family)
MRWEDLLFLHWPVAVAELQRVVPPGLEVETFDGRAWLGVVPFVMARTRWRWLPPMPTAYRFPECNVRTYVRHRDRPGVWFFSLDATSRLVVEGARLGFGLPYFMARMQCRRDGERVHFDSERRDRRGPTAAFRGSWHATGPARPASPGSLEHVLTERYCLYALRRGRVVRGDIAHAPWQLAAADVHVDACDMSRIAGVDLGGAPPSVRAAGQLDVAAWGCTEPRLCTEPGSDNNLA